MTDFDIKTTVAYQDALKVEAKKAKKNVDRLGPTAKLRAETVAWNTLETVGNAVDTVLTEKNTALTTGMMIHYYQPLSAGNISSPKKMRKAASPRGTKKSLAIQAFADNLGAKRKVVITAMMDIADLSDNGAATYYQNIKSGKKGWEV